MITYQTTVLEKLLGHHPQVKSCELDFDQSRNPDPCKPWAWWSDLLD